MNEIKFEHFTFKLDHGYFSVESTTNSIKYCTFTGTQTLSRSMARTMDKDNKFIEKRINAIISNNKAMMRKRGWYFPLKHRINFMEQINAFLIELKLTKGIK